MASVRSSGIGYVLGVNLDHGDPSGLHKSLDLHWSRNQFRLQRGLDLNLIDRELLGSGLGLQDQYTGRLSLAKTWGRQYGRAWLEYGRLRSSAELSTSRVDNRRTFAGMELSWARLQIQTNLGSNVSGATVDTSRREVEWMNSSVSWNANRYVSFRGSVAANRTDLTLIEDSSWFRVDAAARVYLGLLSLECRVYKSDEMFPGANRTDQGFALSVTGRYAGWLPIVTGTKRRGVIR